ncbi:glutathione peroxidase [Acuticoccus kandeliae]|uniref:glutathione peroxidase n=1 Tax=Acuticoccus kandeliae TaxID=2073160 RepID=UPI000D3EB5DA|nr:glutathione peroxidase [Acuticoccus kandeliae]
MPSTTAIEAIPLQRNDGSPATLGDFADTVRLVVNVASKCGLTAQYEGLESLYREKKDDGFVILAFPANNFKGQEPGTDEEIAQFCSVNYDVTFPLFKKISVIGEDIHPLYTALTTAEPDVIGEGPMRERLSSKGIPVGGPGEVLWNFEKFLVARDGSVVARFAPDVTADDPRLREAIDAAITQ